MTISRKMTEIPSMLCRTSTIFKDMMVLSSWILLLFLYRMVVSNISGLEDESLLPFQDKKSSNNVIASLISWEKEIDKYLAKMRGKEYLDSVNMTKTNNISYDIPNRLRYLLQSKYNLFPPGIEKDNRTDGKYFIYRCDKGTMSSCGGWSDRLKGMLTAYIIANLTGRTFKSEFKTLSCNILDYVVPNLVNWSLPVSFHEDLKGDHDDVSIMNMVDNRWFYNNVDKINFINHTAIKGKYVYFKANLDYLDGFRSSIAHRHQISWMANLTRDEISGALFKRLIKLSPRMQKMLDDFLNRNFPNPKHKLVCAHVRMGKNPTIPKDTVVRNTLDVLPNVWTFFNEYSKMQNHRFFLMTDSNQVIDDAKRQLFAKNLSLIPGVIKHVERSHEASDAILCRALEKTILEQFLLMYCDVLMISKSGLSRFAAYVRGSDEGLYCLVNKKVIPCKRRNLKEIFSG